MKRNVPLFMAAEFCRGIYFAYAVATLFYQAIGINYTQLSLLWLAMAITQAILEIPFGILSDKIGHRATVLLGYIAFAGAILLIGMGTDIWLPLAGGALWGVSAALLSGSADAFLYDTLKANDNADDYLRFKGMHSMAASLGIIAGAIPGAYLFEISIRYPWYAHASSIGLAFILFAFTRNPSVRPSDEEDTTKRSHFRNSLTTIWQRKALLWLTIFSTLSIFPLYGMSMIRQPYLVERGVQVIHLGYIFAAIEVLGSIVSFLAHRFEKALGLSWSLLTTISLLLGLYLLLSAVPGYWALLPLAALYACFRFQMIVVNAHSNHRIPSSQRATILSIQSMGSSILLIFFMLSSGLILDALAINRYLVLLSAYFALFLLPLWIARRRFDIT